MREIMVNGKNWTEVLDIIQNIQPKKGRKMKFEYIPIEEFVKALDKYVGVSNYTTEYSDLQYTQISSGQDLFTVKCRITVYDDAGHIVTFKEGLGASEFAYSADKGGRDVNLKNSPVYAQQSAFKTAAKALGCFDFYGTYGSESDDVSDEKPKTSGRSSSSKAKGDATILKVHSDGKFYELEGSGDKPTYKLPVRIDGEDHVSEIIFYPNNYEKIQTKLQTLMQLTAQKAVYLNPSVRPCGERDGKKQFVFLKFN